MTLTVNYLDVVFFSSIAIILIYILKQIQFKWFLSHCKHILLMIAIIACLVSGIIELGYAQDTYNRKVLPGNWYSFYASLNYDEDFNLIKIEKFIESTNSDTPKISAEAASFIISRLQDKHKQQTLEKLKPFIK